MSKITDYFPAASCVLAIAALPLALSAGTFDQLLQAALSLTGMALTIASLVLAIIGIVVFRRGRRRSMRHDESCATETGSRPAREYDPIGRHDHRTMQDTTQCVTILWWQGRKHVTAIRGFVGVTAAAVCLFFPGDDYCCGLPQGFAPSWPASWCGTD